MFVVHWSSPGYLCVLSHLCRYNFYCISSNLRTFRHQTANDKAFSSHLKYSGNLSMKWYQLFLSWKKWILLSSHCCWKTHHLDFCHQRALIAHLKLETRHCDKSHELSVSKCCVLCETAVSKRALYNHNTQNTLIHVLFRIYTLCFTITSFKDLYCLFLNISHLC